MRHLCSMETQKKKTERNTKKNTKDTHKTNNRTTAINERDPTDSSQRV